MSHSGVEVTVTLREVDSRQVYPEMADRILRLGRTRRRDSGESSLMGWDGRD
jgi:hypothetical protein